MNEKQKNIIYLFLQDLVKTRLWETFIKPNIISILRYIRKFIRNIL